MEESSDEQFIYMKDITFNIEKLIHTHKICRLISKEKKNLFDFPITLQNNNSEEEETEAEVIHSLQEQKFFTSNQSNNIRIYEENPKTIEQEHQVFWESKPVNEELTFNIQNQQFDQQLENLQEENNDNCNYQNCRDDNSNNNNNNNIPLPSLINQCLTSDLQYWGLCKVTFQHPISLVDLNQFYYILNTMNISVTVLDNLNSEGTEFYMKFDFLQDELAMFRYPFVIRPGRHPDFVISKEDENQEQEDFYQNQFEDTNYNHYHFPFANNRINLKIFLLYFTVYYLFSNFPKDCSTVSSEDDSNDKKHMESTVELEDNDDYDINELKPVIKFIEMSVFDGKDFLNILI